MNIIRDFIYLDNEKMYSMYSQLFEGITENIIKQKSAESSDTKNNGFTDKSKTNNIEQKVLEASFLTENKVLHDYAYHIFEDKIKTKIYDITKTNEISKDKIKKSFIIKISGTAKINDNNRIKHMLSNFDIMSNSIAYLNFISIIGNISIDELSDKINTNIPKELKDRLKKIVEILKNPKIHAKEMGLLQHPPVELTPILLPQT
jgi:hypothetical protein